MHELAERMLRHIRREELLRAGERVGVAVSGGIDSVGLLRLLIELRREVGIVISVVHFNHRLRGDQSDADQEFVAGLAREHGLEVYFSSGDVAELAAEEHSGTEAAARELRYGFFYELLGARGSNEFESEILQGLKPESSVGLNGALRLRSGQAAEAAPLQNPNLPTAGAASLQKQVNRSAERAAPPQNGSTPTILLEKIATGHTLDDQAETVLMRLIRGTGMRGLGGIYPRVVVEGDDGETHGEIVRPLLKIRRCQLGKYLTDLKQPWREDSSNADSKFTRNRVRKLVLPVLEREFNPVVVENFAELAEIARDEEDYWDNEISGWLGTVVQWSQPEWTRGLQGFDGSQGLVQIQPSQAVANDAQLLERLEEPGPAVMNVSVSRPWLLTEPRAVQRRVLKAIGERVGIPLEFKHVEEILRLAAEEGPAGKELSLPLGWKIVREPESMVFATPDLRRQERVPDYEYLLPVPGRALVPELGVVIEALPVTLNINSESVASDFLTSRTLTSKIRDAEYNPQQLLRADLLRGALTVRNWRAGDRFWPANTKSPKKIKELLQARHVGQPGRRLWPVVVSGDDGEIMWMRGFPVPARFCAKAGQEAVVIRETPWAE